MEVKFEYNSDIKQTIKCKKSENIKQVCLKFCRDNGLNFKNCLFLLNGASLNENDGDYDKEVAFFAGKADILNILVYPIYDESFCQKNKNKIILFSIIGVIIITTLIIILTILLGRNKCKNERCSNFGNDCQCKKCKEGFDLYNGECILYAFYGIYNVDYYHEKINLFNSKKNISDLLAMKIENEIQEPTHDFNFNNINTNKVYYYFKEGASISLSNFFENNNKLIEFSFNSNINNIIITNMKSMFMAVIL